jgi:hypothetical protein
MLARRLLSAGGAPGLTTYTWKFVFNDADKGSYDVVTSGSLSHVYTSGQAFPDVFTSALTIPTNRKITLRIKPGDTESTGGVYRFWAGLEIRTGSDGIQNRDDGDFLWTSYPFKTDATIVIYNTTTNTIIDSWTGNETHVEPYLGYAGHYFYPNNQTQANANSNGGWDSFNIPPAANDSVELRITV